MRQADKRQERNVRTKSRIKTLSKNVRAAVSSLDESATGKSLREAASAIDSAATKGIIHKRTAARRVSRLAKLANKNA